MIRSILPPTADLRDPVLLHNAYRIQHFGLNAFLVALAAWQRGLKVRFLYRFEGSSERFARTLGNPARGEFLAISDGQREHFFHRTLGDKTSKPVSQRCDDKQATKAVLLEAGIPVPDGIQIDRLGFDIGEVDAFTTRHAGKTFHLKPVGGTLGQGAMGHLPADKVLKAIQEHPSRHLLLEEHVPGTYLRAAVVGGRCVGFYARLPPSVTGDGSSTIQQLVDAANSARCHKPLHPGRAIQLGEVEQNFLAAQTLTVDSVLEQGRRARLSNTLSSNEGADIVIVTEALSPGAGEIAVRVCQALDLPVGGVDFLVDEATGGLTVLEANQTPMLKGHAYPYDGTGGNQVAEAIIDYYFPDSVGAYRHIKASFDFSSICSMLAMGVVADVALPVLGPHWRHRRIVIPAAQVNKNSRGSIQLAVIGLGIHAQSLALASGEILLDALAPERQLKELLRTLKPLNARINRI